jgi:hypothetical protein
MTLSGWGNQNEYTAVEDALKNSTQFNERRPSNQLHFSVTAELANGVLASSTPKVEAKPGVFHRKSSSHSHILIMSHNHHGESPSTKTLASSV